MACFRSFSLAHFEQYQNDERLISLFTNTPECKTVFKFDVNKMQSHTFPSTLKLSQMYCEVLLNITTSAKNNSLNPNSILEDFGLKASLSELSGLSDRYDWKLLYGMLAYLKRKPVHSIEDCYLFFIQHYGCLPLLAVLMKELYQISFQACLQEKGATLSPSDGIALMHTLNDFVAMTELMGKKLDKYPPVNIDLPLLSRMMGFMQD